MKKIEERYFEWMCWQVHDSSACKGRTYHKLLRKLHETDFSYILGMDANRAEDGIDLRYRYGYENNISGAELATDLDDKPCSVLEMMIALSIRCEEQIMDNPDIGDRTGQWFWGMVQNMGLFQMDDTRFNVTVVENHIEKFLGRNYSPNGNGGLFTVHHCKKDMRLIEIWYQMMWYLNEVLER